MSDDEDDVFNRRALVGAYFWARLADEPEQVLAALRRRIEKPNGEQA